MRQNAAQFFRRRMIRRRREQEQTDQGGLDISSLIDVSFLLLIYFLVTSTLDPKEGDLQLTMPPPGGSPNQPVFDFDIPLIAVDADGRVTMQEELVETETDNRDLVTLEDRLSTYVEAQQLYGKGDRPAVKLEVDDSVGGQRFIDVMNCFAGVGIEDVRLVGFASE